MLVFEHAAEEIRFFKRQQWSITNYALLLQAAMVAGMGLLDEFYRPIWLIVGRFGCFAIAGCACGLLVATQASIGKERARMDAARRRLPIVALIHAEPLYWPYRAIPMLVLLGANVIACLVALMLITHSK